jgi:hypothetical protein
MDKFAKLNALFAAEATQLELGGLMLNLLLAAALAQALARIYERWGTAPSNRRAFASNFLLITLTTTLVITIVRSSLALSLGLVGALSIVRFRTPVKEPEELAYLFLSIAAGLGLGAGQRAATLLAFAVICAIVVVRARQGRPEAAGNYYLTVSSSGGAVSLERLSEILKKHCALCDLKRVEQSPEALEAVFRLEFSGAESFEAARRELVSLGTVRISFVDGSGGVLD